MNIYVQADLKFVFQLAPLTNMTQIYVIGRSFIMLRTPQTQWYFLRNFGKAHPCDRQLSHLIDSNLRSSTISVRFGFFFIGNLVTFYPSLVLGGSNECVLELWLEFRFPQYIMVDLYGCRVFNGPFPSHRCKLEVK